MIDPSLPWRGRFVDLQRASWFGLSFVHALNVFQAIHRDFKRQGGTLKDPGLWALASYRLGVWSAARAPGPWRWMATRLSRGLAFSVGVLTRTSISPDVKVGEELHLIHGLNV